MQDSSTQRILGGDFENSLKYNVFEEEKQNDLTKEIFQKFINVFHQSPGYFMASVGFIIYVVLMYIFLQYDAVIQNDPKVKWRISQYNQDYEKMKEEVKKRFKEQQKQRRQSRKEYQKEQLEEKLSKMNEKDRIEYLEQLNQKKQNLKNEENITTIAVLMQKRDWYPDDQYITGNDLKKLIQNVKTDLQKQKKWDDDYNELYENSNTLEEKIYYGSESSEEEDPNQQENFLKLIADTMKDDVISYNDIIEIYQMLVEYNKNDQSDQSSSEQESDDIYDAQNVSEEIEFELKKSDSSGQSTPKSNKIIEFDNEGQIIPKKKRNKKNKNRNADKQIDILLQKKHQLVKDLESKQILLDAENDEQKGKDHSDGFYITRPKNRKKEIELMEFEEEKQEDSSYRF